MKTTYASKAALLAIAFVTIPAAMPSVASAQSVPERSVNPAPPTTPEPSVNPAPPVIPERSVNPAPPTAPVVPVVPVVPVTVIPTTVSPPAQPIVSVNPAPPTTPVVPVTPTAPTTPVVAVNPAPPTTPVAPVNPAPPTTPVVAVNPAPPTTPVVAVNPAPPTTSTTPATVTAPATLAPAAPVIAPVTPGEVVSALAGSTRRAQAMTHTILDGSHHRPLMSYGGAPGLRNCFWATGDVTRGSGGNPATGGLAEIGLCRDFADGALRAGLGIGRATQRQDLDGGGASKLSGNHVVGELNYRTPSGLLLSALGVFADWTTDLQRGPATPGAGQSTGSTGIRSTSLRLRADWVDAWRLGGAGITPYAAVTTSRTRTGGYTETGGDSPATFDALRYSTSEFRLGVASTFALVGASRLRTSIEASHRFDGDGPAISGRVPGQFAFSEAVAAGPRTWMRAGLDLDVPLSPAVLLAFSVHAATRSASPRLTGSVSLRAAF